MVSVLDEGPQNYVGGSVFGVNGVFGRDGALFRRVLEGARIAS